MVMGFIPGLKDRARGDKDEGYEVLHFIEDLMNEYGLTSIEDVHNIENILHIPEYSSIDQRAELKDKVILLLGLKRQ